MVIPVAGLNMDKTHRMIHSSLAYTVFFLILFSIFGSSTMIINTSASPSWLIEGFYAKYFIYTTDFRFLNISSPYDYNVFDELLFANGTLLWKVLKINSDMALIKVNFSVTGFYGPDPSLWEKRTFAKSFKIMVNISDRFILNTSRIDPLYFPYWVPIGTRENDRIFLGHQPLLNFWLNGLFMGYGVSQYVVTSWKTFHASDILALWATNISGVKKMNPYMHLSPNFMAYYDRDSGIMIGIHGAEPILLRFLNIFTDGKYTASMLAEITLDNVGMEQTEMEENESSCPEVVSITISSIIVPPNVESGKEFNAILTLENNGTGVTKGLKLVLKSLNKSVDLPPPINVDIIYPGRSLDVEMRIKFLNEGRYDLYCEVYKDDEKLFRKDFSILCKSSSLQMMALLIILFFVFIIIFISVAFLRRINRR